MYSTRSPSSAVRLQVSPMSCTSKGAARPRIRAAGRDRALQHIQLPSVRARARAGRAGCRPMSRHAYQPAVLLQSRTSLTMVLLGRACAPPVGRGRGGGTERATASITRRARAGRRGGIGGVGHVDGLFPDDDASVAARAGRTRLWRDLRGFRFSFALAAPRQSAPGSARRQNRPQRSGGAAQKEVRRSAFRWHGTSPGQPPARDGDKGMKQTLDYIVAGGGSAGCELANRLSACAAIRFACGGGTARHQSVDPSADRLRQRRCSTRP